MLKWLLYFILNWPLQIFCYITNFIVVFFCKDNGELEGFLHNWQTWDDSTDSEWFMTEVIPKSFIGKYIDYDFKKFYIGQETVEIPGTNRTTLVSIRNINQMTIKEKIQRYICRVLWLTRNCCYGFCFGLFGRDICAGDLTYKINTAEERFAYDSRKNILFTDWVFKKDNKICDLFGGYYLRWKTFIGWKVGGDSDKSTRAMLATRLMIAVDKD